MHIKTILAATLSTAALLLSSCNTNKKVSKEKETFRERQQLNEERAFAESRQVNIVSHRLSEGQITDDVVLEIKPVGSFHYSLSEGFDGEASLIQVRGTKQHSYLNSIDEEMSKQDDLKLLVKKEEDKERSLQRKSKDKEVQRSMTTPLVVVVVLMALSWLVLKK